MSQRVVIVGGGQAGLETAVALRDGGWDGEITIFGEEKYSPYQRPPLSKAYLSGDSEADDLCLRDEEYLTACNIKVECGETIESIYLPEIGNRDRGYVTTVSHSKTEFDWLVFAVGAGARKLTLPNADLDGICYLRTIDDAATLKQKLSDAKNVVIVGGGFIGLEAAAVASYQAKSVTVVEGASRLLARVVAPEVSEFYKRVHEENGTTVLLGMGVGGFRSDGARVNGVELADGRVLPADLVIVGVGASPRKELALSIGIECRDGIIVDSKARTNHPRVLAVGDCTETPHPLYPGGTFRFESVPNAIAQAKVAAASILGKESVYTEVPWFWSNQGKYKLQIAGVSAGYDRTVVRGSLLEDKWAIYYFCGDRLLAVNAVNSPKDFNLGRKSIAAGTTPEFA